MSHKNWPVAGLVALSVLLSSCTSYFVRKDCEKLNWYQLGYEAALRGERISNDETVNKCRKADAEISESQLDVGFKAGMSRYCQPEGVFLTGKNGDLFNTDFCEPGQLSLLRKRHEEGLKAYCEDGMTAGLSGKKYKNVCTPQAEKKFLPEYRKGRKKYLQGMVQNLESQIRDSDSQLEQLNLEKRMVEGRLYLLPAANPGDQDPYRDERASLSNQSWSLQSEISSKSQERNRMRNEMDAYKQEMVTLD